VGATAKGLFELENTAAYNLTVDHVFGLPHGEAGEAQKELLIQPGFCRGTWFRHFRSREYK
jgi:hypothetical protein